MEDAQTKPVLEPKTMDIDLRQFNDILEKRRETNDIWWISRAIKFSNTYKYVNGLSPDELKETVIKDMELRKFIEEICKREPKAITSILLKVKATVEEIGYSHRLFVIRWLGLLLLKIMKKTLNGLFINETQLMKVKTVMGLNPIVFIPTHRSYADFILMAFLCFNYDIQIPCVAAGMDFHSMWLMGRLLRYSKAFFMRRTFANDNLYRKVFEKYVGKLISKGNSPIEFFIEGTRSRSSKALMPKFGFLTMILESFYGGEVPDVTIVPITISYEKLLEEVLFAYELLGVPKPKESTLGLLRALKTLDRKYGNIFINIGDPISLRDFLGYNQYVTVSKQEKNNHIMNLAYTIINNQQKMQMLGCFHVLAIALSNTLIRSQENKFTYEQACEDVLWISTILKEMGASIQLSDCIKTSMNLVLQQHSNLVKVSENNIINLVDSYISDFDKKKLKGAVLSHETLAKAVPVIMLQLYINPCLHLIVRPAIIILLLQTSSGLFLRNDLQHKYMKICEIFAHEFVFYSERVHEEFQHALNQLEQMNAIQITLNGHVTLLNNDKLYLFFRNVLYPFLMGYYSLCMVLLQESANNKDEHLIFKTAQEFIERGIENGFIRHFYPLSLDLLSCALNSLTSLGALSKVKHGNSTLYDVNINKIKDIAGTIGAVIWRSEQDIFDFSLKPNTLFIFNKSKL